MTRNLPALVALLAAPALAACYVHPPPVDGGPRDAGPRADAPPMEPPVDGSVIDASAEDAQVDAHDTMRDAQVECATDADCEAASCEVAACVDGACTAMPAADDTACDDGDLCTESDACTAGECSGIVRACSACSDAGGAGPTLTTLPALWAKTPEALLPRSEGGVTLTGFADGNLWVAAVGAGGEVLFDRGHGDVSMGDRGFALARPIGATVDARTLVAGYSQIDGGGARPWVIEVDAEGDEIASHVPFGERGGTVHGLVPLPDGATIVLAQVGGRATLARLSAAFDIEWERSYFDVGWAYGLAGVVVLPDGDLVIAGDVGTFPTRSVRVVRARPTGEVLWERSIEADAVNAILARPDGTVVVAGQRYGSAGTGTAWLARLDAAGAVVWERAYGVAPNGSIQSVAAAPDGSLVLAAADGGDAWILRVGGDGALLEEATLSLGAHERAEAVHVLGDGTVIVAGTSDLPDPEDPRHAWVIRAGSVAAMECAD